LIGASFSNTCNSEPPNEPRLVGEWIAYFITKDLTVKLLEPTTIAQASRKGRRRASAAASSADTTHKELIQLFKLLADETRLSVVQLLLEAEEYHVRALCDMLSQSQPAVSHHLALLRRAGLIECRRAGKHNFYRLTPQKLEGLLDLVFADAKVADRRLRLGKYVLIRDA